jgi:hypothetical protein
MLAFTPFTHSQTGRELQARQPLSEDLVAVAQWFTSSRKSLSPAGWLSMPVAVARKKEFVPIIVADVHAPVAPVFRARGKAREQR